MYAHNNNDTAWFVATHAYVCVYVIYISVYLIYSSDNAQKPETKTVSHHSSDNEGTHTKPLPDYDYAVVGKRDVRRIR